MTWAEICVWEVEICRGSEATIGDAGKVRYLKVTVGGQGGGTLAPKPVPTGESRSSDMG